MRLRPSPLNARSVPRIALAVALLAAAASPNTRAAERPAENLDAFVEVDRTAGEWTIGNSGIRYRIVIDGDGTLAVGGLRVSGTDGMIAMGGQPDTVLSIAGDVQRLGAPHSDFVVESVDASSGPHFVTLAVHLSASTRRLTATRHYLVFPGASAVEMWTEIFSADG